MSVLATAVFGCIDRAVIAIIEDRQIQVVVFIEAWNAYISIVVAAVAAAKQARIKTISLIVLHFPPGTRRWTRLDQLNAPE